MGLKTVIVGKNGGEEAGKILSLAVIWLAFALLLLVGLKMLIDGIKELN